MVCKDDLLGTPKLAIPEEIETLFDVIVLYELETEVDEPSRSVL